MKKLLSTLTVVVLMLVIVTGISADEKEDALGKAIETDETFQALESLFDSIPVGADWDICDMAEEAIIAGQSLVIFYHVLNECRDEVKESELPFILNILEGNTAIIEMCLEASLVLAWSDEDYEAISVISWVEALTMPVLDDIFNILDEIFPDGSCSCEDNYIGA